MKPRRLGEIAELLGLPPPLPGLVWGVAVHSVNVKPGDLFFAFRGKKDDGHRHLEEAAMRGAVAAVVDPDYSGHHFDLPLMRIPDGLAALQKIAQHYFHLKQRTVIAVTGSAGKTTTKEFVATLLKRRFRLEKTLGNHNSQIGLALTLLNGNEEADLWVLEMGMTGYNEIARLVEIAPPNYAIISRIGRAHIGFFEEGMKGIARAKGEVLDSPKTELALLHTSCRPFKDEILERGTCRKLFFGEGGDFWLNEKGNGTFTMMEEGKESPPFQLPFPEPHFRDNFTGACALARLMGLSWEELEPRFRWLASIPHRYAHMKHGDVLYIDDSYNASPEAMRAALTHLPPAPTKAGRRIGLLGKMPDLGPHSEACHREIAEIAVQKLDIALCIGEECRPIVELFQAHGKTARLLSGVPEARMRLGETVKPGDLVLIKGANSLKLWESYP